MEHTRAYYLAGSFVRRDALRELRKRIGAQHPDWTCQARWLDFDDEMERQPTLVAELDAHDALTADAVVFMRDTPSSPGKHTELGRSRTGSRFTSSRRRGWTPTNRSPGSFSGSSLRGRHSRRGSQAASNRMTALARVLTNCATR